MISSHHQPGTATVILGASNVTRGLRQCVFLTRQLLPAALDLNFAIGHGRGYGMDSWVLGRYLPPIVNCGLWEKLRSEPERATFVLLTDIGNDLIYGASVDQITEWVTECLRRFQTINSRIVITRIPLASVDKLGVSRFLLFRTIVFPTSKMSHEFALNSAQQLDKNLCDLAKEFDATTVTPKGAWYGLDPIHIQRKYEREAWSLYLSPWQNHNAAESAPARKVNNQRLGWPRPAYRRLLGQEQRTEQPVRSFSDGTTLSLF